MSLKAILAAGSVVVLIMATGCKKAVTIDGHKLGELFAQFSSIEKPVISTQPDIPYTGTVHCYSNQELEDKCAGHVEHPEDGSLPYLDNSHYTFVDGHLVEIESVGAGGLIGDAHQNWNWNLYLSELKKRYGQPDRMSDTEALWKRPDYVVLATLTLKTLRYSGTEAQDERIAVVDRKYYEQQHNKP